MFYETYVDTPALGHPMKEQPHRDHPRVMLLRCLVVAVTYVVTGYIGLSFAIPHTNVSPVFPPSGLALAATMLWSPRIWPGIWVAATIINAMFGYQPTQPALLQALVFAIIGVGTTLQALWGAFLMTRLGAGDRLDRAQFVFKFVAITFFMCLVSSSIGVSSLCIGSLLPWQVGPSVWWTWWLGDSVGVLIVAPFILVWSQKFTKGWSKQSLLEALVLALMLTSFAVGVFGLYAPIKQIHYPLEYLTIPFVLWATFRFGQHGATATVVLLSSVAVWATSRGTGPFAQTSVNASLLLLIVFIAVVTITALALSAVLREQQEVHRKLQMTYETIEEPSVPTSRETALAQNLV